MTFNLSAQTNVNSNNSVIKNQCIYRITVTYTNPKGQVETTIIEYPLTVRFTINKDTFAGSNTANITILNLAQSTRQALFQEAYATDKKKYIEFEAGYGKLTRIFRGLIQECYSHRAGTEIETVIQAMDLGIANEYLSVTFEKDTTFKDAYKYIASQVKDLEIGAIGQLEGTFKTPTTFVGTPFECLNKLTTYCTYINDGKLEMLRNNECLDVPITVMQAESGLIGTPARRGGQIEIECFFKPDITVGQLLEIKSTTSSEFDGVFKVVGVNHSGTISGAEAGQRITRLNLLVGALLPNSNYTGTGNTNAPVFTKVSGESLRPINGSYGSSVEEVYRYIQDHNGAIPNKQITKNISWKEMIGNNNSNQARLSELTKPILSNCQSMAQRLQSYLDAYYPGKTVYIASGWRSSANNSSVGGKSGKYGHLYGNAIDFKINGINSHTAWSTVFRPFYPYYSYVNNGGSIHIQSGGAK